MDELTFISGCVLAGMVAAGPDAYVFDDEATVLLKTMRRLASMHLGRVERQAMQRAILRGDVPPDPADPDPPPPVAALSERDAMAKLTAIIQAVDAAGDWPTEEARADADVVAWVCEAAREMRHLRQQRSQQVDPIVAGLKARQVRLLAALERSRALALLVKGMPLHGLVPNDWPPSREAAPELIELIDLLKLECKPDEDADG
jgi:hypothetical protein